MSLISGSNSLTPTVTGALDLREDIAEKLLRDKELSDDEREKYFGSRIGLPSPKNRAEDLCRSWWVAIRLTVLSEVDITKRRLQSSAQVN